MRSVSRLQTQRVVWYHKVMKQKLGSLLASGADLEKTPIQPTQPHNVHLCWQVTYSCASKLHNFTNRLGRFLVS